MNRRNAAFILDHNPRALYPLVDDKMRMRDLCVQLGVPTPAIDVTVSPRDRWELKTALPEIAVIGGVAVSASRATRATVFDFGPVTGRARLTLNDDSGVAHNVNVRFSNSRADLQAIEGSVEPFVFAARERTVIDPEKREFRYVMVYGSEATVDVLR